MKKSVQQYAREARTVKKKIKSGKLSGKSLVSAKNTYWYLERRAKGIVYKRKKVSKKQAFNKDQGILPGFLKQMDMIRIEELVANRVFQQMKDEKLLKKVEGELAKLDLNRIARKAMKKRKAA